MQIDNDPEHLHQRRDVRERRLLKAQMVHPRHGKIDIVVRDISKRGIGGKCDLDLIAGEDVTICLPSHSPVAGQIAWRIGISFGVTLSRDIDPVLVRNAAGSQNAAYQVPDHFQPTSDFKRPGFGPRNKS